MILRMSETEPIQSQPPPDPLRIISFSDNVLSVAITLLVFNVGVPGDWKQLDLHRAVLVLLPRLFSYVLSFAVIGVYWVAHNNMFRAATQFNRRLMWINNLFLMTICLVPGAAALLGSYHGQFAAVFLYGINLIAVGVSMRFLCFYMVRLHAKTETPIDPGFVKIGNRRIETGLVMAVLGVSSAFVNPWISYVIYSLTPITFAWSQILPA